MNSQQYSVNQHLIETILSWVKTDEIAIPEIQRPFVWNSSKVRDLMDSLYKGYPIGYIISWKNPDVKLKDGRLSEGKRILIDGQQRVTALRAAILGLPVISKDYSSNKIRIAFHPIEERFEVTNPAIQKDVSWISDISLLFGETTDVFDLVDRYCESNRDADKKTVQRNISALGNLVKKQIGMIDLDSALDIETVTEIFIRINSKGVVLSQADFVMSKVASSEKYNGGNLRKCIDYFCNLAVSPESFSKIEEGDTDFVKTKFFLKISWLKHEKDDLYDPDYTDLLRVAFTSEFSRGKLADLVSLLSGRNFEARTYEEERAEDAFERLEAGILNFVNETNFKRFLMIIKSAGFISADLVRSQNALNFAYILYLKLKASNYAQGKIESYVRRWYVLSVLTGRYSGSPESSFDRDIRQINDSSDFGDFLENVEKGELSEAFWSVSLVTALNSSASSSPLYNVFLAAQIKSQDRGFLSRDIAVQDMVLHRGDIHHVFPKDLLKRSGMKKNQYNQIANYVYTQQEINIKIGNKPPQKYIGQMVEQCEGGALMYGAINSVDELKANLTMHCIPENIHEMGVTDYEHFLKARRLLMASKIKAYYQSL